MLPSKWTSDVIQSAVANGFKLGLVSGKRIVRLYICHSCKAKTMVKAYKGKNRYNACKCGYRKSF